MANQAIIARPFKGVWLNAGRFYATEGGDIVYIQSVNRKTCTADGFYLDGQVPNQWWRDGIFCRDWDTNEDINCEVLKDEIKERYPDWYRQCQLPR